MGHCFQPATLLGLCSLFLISVQPAFGQAVVCDSRELLISASYEDVLARMDGEEASRAMFASQSLNMVSYQPKPKDKSEKAEEGVTKGKIEIVGVSCEFGTMYYLMSVRASEKETVIDVRLIQPVGMLRRQSYRYLVTPRGNDQTAISISHELDVVLKSSRLNFANKIIKKVTYEKACEEVRELSEKMSRCVVLLTSRPHNSNDSADDEDDTADVADDAADDQMKGSDESTASPQKDAESEPNSTSSDPAQPSSAIVEPTDPAADSKTNPATDPAPAPVSEPAVAASVPANKDEPQQTNDQQPQATVLSVTIEGVTVASGFMRIALFAQNEQYKNFDARNNEGEQGEAFRKVAVKVKKTEKLVYEFKDIPHGKYAIAAFHDKDGNQQLNASLIGLPSEPYGFSRNARGTFGAPKFEDAVIEFDESSNSFLFKIK